MMMNIGEESLDSSLNISTEALQALKQALEKQRTGNVAEQRKAEQTLKAAVDKGLVRYDDELQKYVLTEQGEKVIHTAEAPVPTKDGIEGYHRVTVNLRSLGAFEDESGLFMRVPNSQGRHYIKLPVGEYTKLNARTAELYIDPKASYTLLDRNGTAVKTLTGDEYVEYYEIKQRAHAPSVAKQSVPVAEQSVPAEPKSVSHSFNAGDTVYATSQYDSTLTFAAYKVDKVVYDELAREAVYRLVDPQGIRPTILQPESCVNVTVFANETETAIVPMSKDAKAAALAAKEKLASAALGGTAKAAATGAAQASAQTAAQTATVAASVATPVTAVAGAAVAGIEKAVKAITR